MPSLSPFNLPGKWYKGNLHTHTTQSDGAISPSENMEWHASHGYHFLGITDHNTLTQPTDFTPEPPLLAIPSVEISAQRGRVEYHVLCIGVDKMPAQRGCDPQEAINGANLQGGIAYIGHPYWHDHTFDDLLSISGHIGIEIFNTSCWLEIQKGHSLVHWDGVMRRGQQVWGLATDDSHFTYPGHGRGWVMVHSEILDRESILASLRQGNFYSSMGPEIFNISLEDRKVTVECSPARSIFLVGDQYYCPYAAQAWDGIPLTQATFELVPGQQYFRVEVVDMDYQSAWSNAYNIRTLQSS